MTGRADPIEKYGESAIAKELVATIEAAYQRVMRHRDRYLKAWIAETGLRPSEAEIVEEHFPAEFGVKIVTTIRRRSA